MKKPVTFTLAVGSLLGCSAASHMSSNKAVGARMLNQRELEQLFYADVVEFSSPAARPQ
jgi:hypothetical protein